MIKRLNECINHIRAVSSLVSMQTKGRWDSWFKVNSNRGEIEAICTKAVAELQRAQIDILLLASTPTRELTYVDECGRTWLPYVLEWENEIDNKPFSTVIWGIDRAHAIDQLEHIKKNGTVTDRLLEAVPR